MHVVMVGLSHKTAPVEIREQVTFPVEIREEALRTILNLDNISECVILSTCNRTEIYATSPDPVQAIDEISGFMASFHDLERLHLQPHIHGVDSGNAISHLFRVSSSLDSMVVGEGQILAQVKEAYAGAQDLDATGNILNRLFHEAIRVGKRVRTETGISESAVSISYAAVELAKQVFGRLDGKHAALIGAGEMAELTAKHLMANGVRRMSVINRTWERAKVLADCTGGTPITWEQLEEQLEKVDIVVSSTGAQEPVLTKKMMAAIMERRRNRPIFMFDIAVPRDIEASVNDLYNVFLYDIDDLQNVVRSNQNERLVEAEKGEDMVREAVDDFASWMLTLEVVPTITALRRKAADIIEIEVQKAFSRLGPMDKRQTDIINGLGKGIANKLLHDPIVRVKELSGKRQGYEYTESLRELFLLDELEPVQGGRGGRDEEPEDLASALHGGPSHKDTQHHAEHDSDDHHENGANTIDLESRRKRSGQDSSGRAGRDS